MTTALAAGCLGSGVGSWCRGLHGHAKSGDPSLNQGNPRTSIAATWFSHVCQLSSTRKPTTAEPWQSSPTERRRPLEQATPATVLKHLCHAVNEVRAGIPPESPPPAEEVLQWIGSRRLSGQVQPWLGRTDGSEGRCAEGCQEALCGREDCPQGLQVGGGGVCGVQRVRGPKVG